MPYQRALQAEDQNARARLHRLVDQSTRPSLNKIRAVYGSGAELACIAKPVEEVQRLSSMTDSYTADVSNRCDEASAQLEECGISNGNSELLNSMEDLYNEILQEDEEQRVPLLIAYEELLHDVANVRDSKMLQILKSRVVRMKQKIQDELYKAFNNNINTTLKIVSEIRMLGISTDHEIAAGFIKNRSEYISECLKTVQSLAKENVHRAIHEVTLTLKTKILSIIVCYTAIFGSMDANVTSLMRTTIFQFLHLLKQELHDAQTSQLMPKHVADVQQEMGEISHSFESFGLSFTPLLHEIFATYTA
ncbi:peptide chain release factor 1, putative [Babesia ovata]|uniref:Peptide chain release factor 1, putative n=1 Tax=Babesia ovata TaxID=189622 RepID=A0A2H6KJC0_9APIC|nr:peptide chain release factor 1, putative [Babesia ovata]GBE63087.1 peptide chain release factor 1, putative [Babesia ovata]